MAGASPWPTIHAERKTLADDLASLTDKQWATQSLCSGWSVQQVLGHMTGATEITPVSFFPKLVGAGFSLEKLNAKNVARQTAGTPADTLAAFKARVTSSNHPPGPVETWLGETIVHSEDIRRPLKISHDYPADAMIRVAESYKKTNLVLGGKKRIAGLALKATDADWSAGIGPEVTGPMISLLLAIAGRPSALNDLSGKGLDTLRSRM